MLDLRRRADLGCGIEPVILTGGERSRMRAGCGMCRNTTWLAGSRLEKREIEIPAKYGPALLLGKELANMGTGG